MGKRVEHDVWVAVVETSGGYREVRVFATEEEAKAYGLFDPAADAWVEAVVYQATFVQEC